MSAASYSFRPARSFTERAGLFVALVGPTNCGKTFSALRLARGIAGPKGRIAVADTEGGRTLHLREHFDFDAMLLEPPFRPKVFADVAESAERDGYDCLLIDSFSMEWAGIGGVLDWQAAELKRMAGDDWKKQQSMKMASWIAPKMAHKAMVFSFLQRRIPIIFSIRGEETIKPGANQGDKPEKIFKMVCNQSFPFEVTVSFRLAAASKGIIDLSDASAWKMEGAHEAIFRHGEQLSEEHGTKLAAWACGEGLAAAAPMSPFAMLSPSYEVQRPKTADQWVKWCGAAIGGVGPDGIAKWASEMRPHITAAREAGFDAAAEAVLDLIQKARSTPADGGDDGQ